MFEVGKRYEFEMKDCIEKNTLNYHHAEVLSWEPPLLKLRNDDGKEWVLNTSSALFIRAEEQAPATGEFWDDLRKRMAEAKTPS